MRKFEKIAKYKDIELNSPKRATHASAGYDLAASEDTVIKSQEVVLVPTGFKVKMKKQEVLLVFARSSLCIRHKLILANGVGVIDSDYYNSKKTEGHIMIPLLNISNQEVVIKKDERIAQGIFTTYKKATKEIIPQQVRSGGFGSSKEE